MNTLDAQCSLPLIYENLSRAAQQALTYKDKYAPEDHAVLEALAAQHQGVYVRSLGRKSLTGEALARGVLVEDPTHPPKVFSILLPWEIYSPMYEGEVSS